MVARVGMVFSLPVMTCMPSLCTLASLLILILAAVAQAAALYSVTGLTLPVLT